jgi:hypothetical protein
MSGALPAPHHSSPRSSRNMPDYDSDDEITMGEYSDHPSGQRPNYSTKEHKQGAYTVSYATGAGGTSNDQSISYSKPINPSYTATPQYGTGISAPVRSISGTTSYSPPRSSGFKYAEPPTQIRYSRKPQIENPQTLSSEEDAPKKKKKDKKDKKDKAARDRNAMPPPPLPGNPYNVMTMEPGRHPSVSASSYPMPPMAAMAGGTPYPSGTSMFPSSHGAPPPVPPPPAGYDPSGYDPSGYDQSGYDPPDIGGGRRNKSSNSRNVSYMDGAKVLEVTPGGSGKSSSPPRRSRGKSEATLQPFPGMPEDVRGLSPGGDMRKRLDRLSVSGDRPDIRRMSGGMPPPSPLLEPYRGTWQSMGGMPSPMMHPIDAEYDDYSFDELERLEPRRSNASMNRVSSSERDVKVVRIDSQKDSGKRRSDSPKKKKDKPKKTVSMYEAEQDAKAIARQLVRSDPDVRILTDILPKLSNDEIDGLQLAYKKVVKQNGQGVKLSNHIKTKVPRGMFNTLAYVTALGRWESEGYWANYWYQGDTSKRELLIESLMGRTNSEMKLIKEGFKDKRYGNSLERCMDKELRRDKFRTAILMVLDERRQEENDVWPKEYVQRDVDTWAKALRNKDGGETAMLEVCVCRSDRHLRECLRHFERQEGINFAKEVLKRSSNLVVSFYYITLSEIVLTTFPQGEVIVHILNGVINRPARDSMLLQHALIDLRPRRRSSTSSSNSKEGSPRSSMSKFNPLVGLTDKQRDAQDRKGRYELLISRLVRLHWDQSHMMRVKAEYKEKYGVYVEDDVEDYVKEGEFQEFCLALLEPRRG